MAASSCRPATTPAVRKRISGQVQQAERSPAPEGVTEAMYKRTTEITDYKVLEAQDVDLGRIGGMTWRDDRRCR